MRDDDRTVITIWSLFASFVVATAILMPRSAVAGCNPGTQDIADCINVPRTTQTSTSYPRTNGSYPGGYSGGATGGGRAAAAIGAANAAIGILSVMIDAAQKAERANQNAANEAARRHWNYCQGQYKQAHTLNERARSLSANDPQEAYTLFEQAIDMLGSCGARSDLAKLQKNLENARQEFASLTNPSSSPSHFGGGAPKNQVFFPADLYERAAAACTHLTENTPEWQSCFRNREAEFVMLSDADTRAACQSLGEMDARNQCVFNRYWAAMYGKDPNAFGDPKNCYWDEHGNPCYPGGHVTAAAQSNPATEQNSSTELRDELRRRLSAGGANGPSEIEKARVAEIARAKALRDSLPLDSPYRKQLDEVIAKAEAGQIPIGGESARMSPQDSTQAQPQEASSPALEQVSPGPTQNSFNDQAYENFMQSGNNISSNNRGELGAPHPGVQDMKPLPIGK